MQLYYNHTHIFTSSINETHNQKTELQIIRRRRIKENKCLCLEKYNLFFEKENQIKAKKKKEKRNKVRKYRR